MELNEILRFSDREHWLRLCFLGEADIDQRYYRTLVRLDRFLYEVIDELDDTELVLWCVQKSLWLCDIACLAKNNRLNVLKTLICEVGNKLAIATFRYVCGHGHIDFAKWLIETFGLDENTPAVFGTGRTSRPIEIKDGVGITPSYGIKEWSGNERYLVEGYGNIKEFDKAFERAAAYDQLEVLKWLNTIFTVERGSVVRAFEYTTNYGYDDTMKWLYETFELTKEEVISCDNSALMNAVKSGNLSAVKYLHERFKFTMNANIAAVIQTAATDGRFGILKWLCNTYIQD